jgi:ribonuclease P protein component
VRTGISGDRSFVKVNRLHGRTNFLKVFQSEKSRKVTGQYCRITSIGATDSETRFAVVISRGAGGAVRRNRIKRIIREYLRNNKNLWPSGEMIVIGVNKPVLDENALLGEIETMLRDLR